MARRTIEADDNDESKRATGTRGARDKASAPRRATAKTPRKKTHAKAKPNRAAAR